MCKRFIKDMGLKVVATYGRTFVVKPKPNFLCSRWYIYIVVAQNHENLDKLIREGQMSLKEWRESNRRERDKWAHLRSERCAEVL